MKRIFLALIILFSFSACQKEKTPQPIIKTVKKSKAQPTWIFSPNIDEKVGAVGSAFPHFKGKTYQRRLAVSRGLEELAQQSGVQVQSTIKTIQKRNGSQTNARAEIYTIQNSANETIKAHIEEVWSDPQTQELYIWLVAD